MSGHLSRWRPAFLALAAVSASLLTITRIGASPVAPGPDLGFAAAPDPSDVRLVLRSDAGDLHCSIRLVTQVLPAEVTFGIASGDAVPVSISSEHRSDGAWELHLHANEGTVSEPFEWRNGVPLYVWATTGGRRMLVELADWEVFPTDQASDTRSKARARAWWSRVSFVMLLLSIAGIVIERLSPERKTGPDVLTPERCVALVIDAIDGADEAETRRIRTMLRKVFVEGARPEEALESTGLSKKVQRQQAWFKARALLMARLDTLLTVLTRVRADLDK